MPPGRERTAGAGYSPGVVVANRRLVFVAGHTGQDDEGRPIADPEAQFVSLFERLRQVLAAADGSFADVVDMTSYHVSFDTLEVFLKVKARYLTGPVQPAWTAIGVSALGIPGCLVEVKLTAAV
ncbi:RidA family protein [Amycolatopsis echigonensis]|uniref:RidA family protein n=1 Tax=Amycolatopsis echigonensis TaxID=2576905 RepID=A0A8E1VW71_9PSEU|nr:RidA family protein [Amycolatopsis echigonensis]